MGLIFRKKNKQRGSPAQGFKSNNIFITIQQTSHEKTSHYHLPPTPIKVLWKKLVNDDFKSYFSK